jgi:hypothetical protein
MRNRNRIAAMAAALFAAAPALAEVNVGDKAPSIRVGAWYNLPKGVSGLQDQHMRGQILMVEFWATW